MCVAAEIIIMTFLVHNFGARLRAILGLESWDYCVIWRLSEDQRVLEWVDCCCAGAESLHNGEEPLLFPVSSTLACKDVMIQHPRTKSCDLLTLLPSMVPLDSGIHAQAFMSNQATWMNFSPNLDSTVSEETVGTRVLIPVPGGLVEFFVAKQVPEDPQVIEFITAQCSITLQQQPMSHSRINLDGFHDNAPSVEIDQNDPRDGFINFTVKENIDMAPRHISIDPGPQCHSSTIFSQHHNQGSDCPGGAGSKNSVMFFQETHDHELNPFKPSTESGGARGDMDLLQKGMRGHHHQGNPSFMHLEPLEEDKDDQGNDNDSFKGRSNSMSDSDGNEDDEDPKYRRRTGKGTQCKNLEAERKRRKKLNERLYTLRSMVPKISKLDRASIIKDAIEFVKDLRKQVKDLQNELEEHSDDEDQSNIETSKSKEQEERFQHNGMNFGYKSERGKFTSRYQNGIAGPKQRQESENIVDRVQQMEPQVEVAQLDGNEFFIRVFCEHKPGGFLRLMQALDSLGLEASSVNATRHTCLVSNIFKVERKDHEMLQADHVRDSLLELTRNPPQRVDWDD